MAAINGASYRENGHGACAVLFETSGTSISGCPRRKNVINEQNILPADRIGVRDAECLFDRQLAGPIVHSGAMDRRVYRPLKCRSKDRHLQIPRNDSGDHFCLIESALQLTLFRERYGHKDIEISFTLSVER